jgi:hypothetical protein
VAVLRFSLIRICDWPAFPISLLQRLNRARYPQVMTLGQVKQQFDNLFDTMRG